MDVGFYLSELLMRQSEVSVPGLGYFIQARAGSYYNESEGVLYPPHYQVQFDPRSNDNDALVQYIADKKGISLASAQYFIEKYIAGLKEQAATNEAAIGNIGWFYTEQSQLTFKPNNKAANGSAFYDYPHVKINKLNRDEVAEDPTKLPEPAIEPAATTDEPTENITPIQEETGQEQDEYIEDDAERRGSSRTWLILTCTILIAAALFGLYEYNPAVFNKLNFWQQDTQATILVKHQADTTKTDSAKIIAQDTSLKTSAIAKPATAASQAVTDTLNKIRFEVIATSFKTTAMANIAIKNYKSIGIDAHVVTDAPGRRLKITVGTYATRKEAEAARIKLVTARKIQKDAFLLPINPKQ